MSEEQTIEFWEAEVNRLRSELATAKDRLDEARVKASGVSVGQIVMHNGKEHRVTEIDASWARAKPWLYGNPKKADGTFGTARRSLYSDWEPT